MTARQRAPTLLAVLTSSRLLLLACLPLSAAGRPLNAGRVPQADELVAGAPEAAVGLTQAALPPSAAPTGASFSGLELEDASDVLATARLSLPVTAIVVSAPGRLNATDDDVAFLMDNLGADYRPVGLRFYLAGVERVNSQAWAADCKDSAGDIYRAHADPDRPALYVLLCETEASKDGYHSPEWRQMVMVGLHTLPSNSDYPKKHVLTHEVGHLFGLRHTFVASCQDAAAANAGSYYMPAQRKVFDCSKGQDSCPDQPGLDFVTGFMGYCQDDIKSAFSREEVEWMWRTLRTDTGLAALYRLAAGDSGST